MFRNIGSDTWGADVFQPKASYAASPSGFLCCMGLMTPDDGFTLLSLVGVDIFLDGVGHMPPIPIVERFSGRVPQLVDDGLRTEVEIDE